MDVALTASHRASAARVLTSSAASSTVHSRFSPSDVIGIIPARACTGATRGEAPPAQASARLEHAEKTRLAAYHMRHAQS